MQDPFRPQRWLGLTLIAAVCSASVAWATPAVPGYDRVKSGGGEWQRPAGELLYSELSCGACHDPEAKRKSTLTMKPGPDLASAGNRLRADFIRKFLANPVAVKPGTTMPDLLAGLAGAEKTEMVEDLTHYLMSQREKRGAAERPAGDANTGNQLFSSVGCVACHQSAEMPWVHGKYRRGELARFLEKPLLVRAGARMPDQRLSNTEAAHLAALLDPSNAGDDSFTTDPARVDRGRNAFQSLGCVACHVRDHSREPVAVKNLDTGCLGEKPAGSVPRYALDADQRSALKVALGTKNGSAAKEDPKAAIKRLMLQRDCFACHTRDQIGGPNADLAAHFTSTKDDLGDLGRIPPALDGVGRKLQVTALESVMRGRDLVRSYMNVRMPDFGEEFARETSKLFAAADADPNEVPTTLKSDPNKVGRNEWGRELVGITGYACIACHDLQNRKSLGIGAYDLAQMPKRLRPEWMRDFLLNPAAFPTGTRMPPFWPGGKPTNPKIGGGKDPLRQIDSIRVYLTEIDQSLPPLGFADAAAFELKPKDRPIVFRSFIAGAGTHAIAVGFPQGVHAAFDSLEVRWALAWRGRYFDADGTWNQRFIKLEKPLGEDLVQIGEIGTLKIAGQEKLAPQFRGYRVDKEGVPTFQYTLGPLTIDDRIEPDSARGLRRTIRVSGQTNETVQFIAQAPKGITLKRGGGSPLPTTLEFADGKAELVEEISW